MRRVRFLVAGLAAMAVLMPGMPARADEETLRRRIEELETQQRQILEELKAMKRELDAEREKRAAPVAAPAPPAVVAPAPVAAPAPAAAPAAAPVQAAQPPAEGGEGTRVTEVERRQNILTEEIRKIRDFLVLPETQELKGRYGLGPAAS
jgi:hypothetical protein